MVNELSLNVVILTIYKFRKVLEKTKEPRWDPGDGKLDTWMKSTHCRNFYRIICSIVQHLICMTTMRKNPEFSFTRNSGHYVDTVGSARRHTSKVAMDKVFLCSCVLGVVFHLDFAKLFLIAIKLVIFSRLSDVFYCFARRQLTHSDLTLWITMTGHMFVSLYIEVQKTLFLRGPLRKHTNGSSSNDVLPTPHKQTRRNSLRMQYFFPLNTRLVYCSYWGAVS